MKTFMWVMFGCVLLFLLLLRAYTFVPKLPVSQSEVDVWWVKPHRLCDDMGVCCYHIPKSSSLSCVATQINITVAPGDIYDEREPQSGPQTEGEDGYTALEGRVFRDPQFRGIRVPSSGVH